MDNQKRLRLSACSFAFVFSSAQSLMMVLYPFLAEKLHVSLSTLIMCFSLGSFLFVFGSPFWAHKSDQWGRAPVLRIGLVGLIVSFSILIFLVSSPFTNPMMNILFLVLSRVVYGLVASSIAPVSQALQSDLADDKVSNTQAMMLHSISLSLGRVVGVASLVFLHDQVPNILIAFLILMSLVVILFKGQTTVRATAQAFSLSGWMNNMAQVKWVIILAFAFTCFVEALNSSLAGHIKNIFALESVATIQLTSRLFLIANIGILLVQILGRFFAKFSWTKGMAVGLLCLLIGSVWFGFVQTTTDLWLCMFFLVIGIGLVPPLYLSQLRKKEFLSVQGQLAGIVGAAHTLGFTLGGMLAALVFKVAAFNLGYVMASIVLLLAYASFQQRRVV